MYILYIYIGLHTHEHEQHYDDVFGGRKGDTKRTKRCDCMKEKRKKKK